MLRKRASPAITNGRPLTPLLYPTQGVITRTPRQHDKESEGNKRQVKLEKAIQPAHFSQIAQLPVAKAGTWRNFHDQARWGTSQPPFAYVLTTAFPTAGREATTTQTIQPTAENNC